MRDRYLAVAVALAAVVGCLLFSALFGGNALVPADGIFLFPPWGEAPRESVSNPLLVDQFLHLHPFSRFLHERWWAGRMPLWNPLINCGVPFIASMQTAALFPIHLLLAPLDPFYASGWAAFLKLTLGGLFMLLYLRGLGARAAACAVSAAAFSLSGYMIVWLGHPHVNVAMWIPLLLWLIDKGLDVPRHWVLFAISCACMILGGHPPTIVQTGLFCFAYFVWRSPSGMRYRDIGIFLSAAGAGALLAAPQLLPFFEYLGEGSVGAASESLVRWKTSRTPWTLIHYLQPYLAGGPTVGFEGLGSVLGYGGHENFNERTNYVGVVTLFLAAAALRYRKERRVLFFGGAVLFSLAAVLGFWPISWIFAWVPGLNQTSPARLSLFAGFSLSVLAGLGLDTLLQGKRPADYRRFALLCAGAAGLIVFAASLYVGVSGTARRLGAEHFVAVQAFVAVAGLLVIACTATRYAAKSRVFMGGLCAVWVFLDMWAFARGYNPAVPPSVYYPMPDAVRFLKRDPEMHRMTALGNVFPPNTNMVFGMQDVRGQDFMSVRRFEELATGRSGNFHFYSSAGTLPPTLASMNVKYVLTRSGSAPPRPGWEKVYSGDVDVFEAQPYTPRAIVVSTHEVLGSREEVLARMARGDFDPRETVLFEDSPSASLHLASPGDVEDASASAKILLYEPDQVLVRAHLKQPGYLVLLDTYYPGWKASAQGRPLPIMRADYNFRAVALPAGRFDVRFRYEPASFSLGVLLSFCSAALLLAVWKRRPHKRART